MENFPTELKKKKQTILFTAEYYIIYRELIIWLTKWFLVPPTVFFLIYLFYLYLFLAALGLHCCARALSSCGEWELLFIAVHGLLVAVASLVAEHGL